MTHTTRRLLGSALLLLAAGTGATVAPVAAHAAGLSATIDVVSQLKVRSAPSLTAGVVGTLRDGQKVSIDCAVRGQMVRGKVRASAQWDRLTNGRYVAHAYVRTGATVVDCATKTAKQTFVLGKVRTADGGVNVRSGPSVQSTIVRKLPDGAPLKVACAVPGATVQGTVRTSAQWNRLTDGSYIAHAYVLSGAVKSCPATPAPTPAPSVPVLTPEQFIKAAAPGAQQGWREYGVPPSTTIAQAILESGWGRSGLSSVDRNYFGIKCQRGFHGPHANGCHVYKTTECDKAGKCFPFEDAFRTYASMGHSFRDHGHFLKSNKRYAPAFAYTKDANRFIWTVWKAGYATDPNYYPKVTKIMADYDLYRYDTWK